MSFELTKKTKKKFIWFPEKGLPAVVLCLCAVSILAIGAAGNKPLIGDESWIEKVQLFFKARYVGSQMLYAGVGFIIMLLVGLVPQKYYKQFANFIYWASVSVLALVLLVGTRAGGTKGWFNIPLLSSLMGAESTIQPSEFAKLGVILYLARLISKHEGNIDTWGKLIPIAAYFALPFGLVILQPDYGTAIVYLVVFIVLLFVGGMHWKLFAISGGAMAASLPLVWFFLFGEVQKNRFAVFFNPALDALNNGAAQHVAKSKLSIGSGMFFGRGIFDTGSMGQLNFLAVKYTDFIFAIIGEAFGFLGVIMVILLFCWLLYRLLILARSCRDEFGTLIIAGVLSMQFVHVFENIGMTMGVMPVTGIPLPFISVGGSALMANMISIGVVLSVIRYTPRPEAERLLPQGHLLRVQKKRRPLPTME
ncbi:MAG: rod shape-determining protein RodA [Clostridia bacterium]|nr:rod shape-determining protein RodA [Clostridia bacterium]